MTPEQEITNKKSKGVPKKDLLKLQRPIFQLKRDNQGKVQSIIAKLMERKQKPEIGPLARSPLIEQLQKFIPKISQSNNQLMTQTTPQELKFDANLVPVEDSQSSDSQQMANENEEMEVQKEEPQILESIDQFEFNILKYPYLPREQSSLETKNQETLKIKQVKETNKLQQLQ